MLIIVLLWGLSGIQYALAQTSSNVRLSKNADFSTEDRQFKPSDRLYILVTAPDIDYTDLDKNEYELKSAGNGPDLEGTLQNNRNGSYEAQIPLQFTDGNGAAWEVRIRLEDESEHEFIREISITIIEDNNDGAGDDNASDETGDENAEEDASDDDSGDGNADDDDASGGDGTADDGTNDDADTDDGTGNDDSAEDDASSDESGDGNADDNTEDDAESDDDASGPENTGRPELVPPQFHLYQNYPNPFHQQTTILFDILEDAPQQVQLTLYDVLGREISQLVDTMLDTGKHEVTLSLSSMDTATLSNGTYFYRLEINGFTQTRSFSIVR